MIFLCVLEMAGKSHTSPRLFIVGQVSENVGHVSRVREKSNKLPCMYYN